MSATKTFKIGLSATDKQNMAQDVYERVLALTFAEYDSGETYNTGDFVVYSDTLYQCLEDNVTGAWDSTKWQQATLQDLLDDIESAVASVNGKADILSLENGTLVVAKAQTAQELEAVSPESGDTQETPFILQGTGTANGTAIVDTGTIGKHIQKQGSVYCVNQLCDTVTTSSTQNDIAISYNSTTHKIHAQGTANGDAYINLNVTAIQTIAGHKYLLKGCPSGGSSSTYKIYLGGNLVDADTGNGSIFEVSTAGSRYIVLYVKSGESVNLDIIPQLIDITQWFNGNIPTTLTADNFSLYHNYGDYIPYNAGELVASNGKYLISYGRNVWDEIAENGIINTSTGGNISTNDYIRSKNYIRVIPNSSYNYKGTIADYNGQTGVITFVYYDKNKQVISSESKNAAQYALSKIFTTPSNCVYIRFYTTGGTYQNNITISLYYAGEDYSQYYPYEEPHVYDTGDETLLSTGVKINETSGLREDIFDYKTPDGSIVHRVGVVDLGTLDWTYNSNVPGFIATLTGAKIPTNDSYPANILCSKYENHARSTMTDKQIAYNTSNYVVVKDSSAGTDAAAFKIAMNGVYLYYELTIPTTEQGTAFAENVDIDDFGSMGWYSAYTNETTNTSVNVPQGCRLFYQAWYRGFIDSLGQREDIDWDAGNIAAKGVLAEGDPDTLKGVITLFNNRIPALPSDSVDGTYTLKATMSDGTITYTWVAE